MHAHGLLHCCLFSAACLSSALGNTSGYELARRFNSWKNVTYKKKGFAHGTDAVISKKLGMIFVDNVKSGSQTVRNRIKDATGAYWQHWEIEEHKGCGGCCHRTGTACVTESESRKLFRWSIVRDPVKKFESGVRQIWSRGGENADLSADELLTKQLRMPLGKWIDEHAASNTWRLTGRTRGANANALALSFVGKLERLYTDWPAVVGEIVRRSKRSTFRKALLKPLPHTHALSHMNKRTGKTSLLSFGAIRRMCASAHYGDEWSAFDYPKPAACATKRRRRAMGAPNASFVRARRVDAHI